MQNDKVNEQAAERGTPVPSKSLKIQRWKKKKIGQTNTTHRYIHIYICVYVNISVWMPFFEITWGMGRLYSELWDAATRGWQGLLVA